MSRNVHWNHLTPSFRLMTVLTGRESCVALLSSCYMHKSTSKVTIATGSSVLRTVWDSMRRIHLHSYTLFLLIRGSSTARIEKIGIFGLFRWKFLQILPQLIFFKNLSVRIILILDATFVPNLKFIGILSPEISSREKIVTHPPYFTTREFRTVGYISHQLRC